MFSLKLDALQKKLKTNIANILTLANLSLGGFAILATMRGEYNQALLLIFVAALADRFDGQVARRLHTVSDLGKQLDSMCDLISFGVAPALLIYQSVVYDLGFPAMFLTVFYIACGAFRLARFNITESNGFYTGVPITVAGVLLTFTYFLNDVFPPQVFMFLIILFSYLMVGTFRIKKV